jgi:hypothetical protein
VTWSYAYARAKQDALDAASCAVAWLEDLAGIDLGHECNHAVAEALKNLRTVFAFLRHPERKER